MIASAFEVGDAVAADPLVEVGDPAFRVAGDHEFPEERDVAVAERGLSAASVAIGDAIADEEDRLSVLKCVHVRSCRWKVDV